MGMVLNKQQIRKAQSEILHQLKQLKPEQVSAVSQLLQQKDLPDLLKKQEIGESKIYPHVLGVLKPVSSNEVLANEVFAHWITRSVMFGKTLTEIEEITSSPEKLVQRIVDALKNICEIMGITPRELLKPNSIPGIHDVHNQKLQDLRKEHARTLRDAQDKLENNHQQCVAKIHADHKATLQQKNREIKSLTDEKHSRYLKENNVRIEHKTALNDLRANERSEYQTKLTAIRQNIVEGHKKVLDVKDAVLRAMKKQNRQLLTDNNAMREEVTKLEAFEHAAKTKIASLKLQVKSHRKQSPKLVRNGNENLMLLQVEALNLQIIDLMQAEKDASTQHASDAISKNAEISSLKSRLAKARQQSELTELRCKLSKATHALAKAQRKADALDELLLCTAALRDRFAVKDRA